MSEAGSSLPAWVQIVGVGIAFLMAAVCQKVATSKGRDPMGWGLAGLLFWPVALPWVLLLPKDPTTYRACPHCTTMIPRAASVCAQCSRDVEPSAG